MKIYLVEDHIMFREALISLLNDHLDHEVIGHSNNGKEFLATFKNGKIEVDIILMDINMPIMNGLETTRKILWDDNRYKIIAVSQSIENVSLYLLISQGFKGLITKDEVYEKMEEALTTVYNGGMYFPDSIDLIKNKHF